MRSRNSLMRERQEAFRDARLIVIASEGKDTEGMQSARGKRRCVRLNHRSAAEELLHAHLPRPFGCRGNEMRRHLPRDIRGKQREASANALSQRARDAEMAEGQRYSHIDSLIAFVKVYTRFSFGLGHNRRHSLYSWG